MSHNDSYIWKYLSEKYSEIKELWIAYIHVIKSSIKIQNLYINFLLLTPLHLLQEQAKLLGIYSVWFSLVSPLENKMQVATGQFYRFHLQLNTSLIPSFNKGTLQQFFHQNKQIRCLCIQHVFAYSLNKTCRQCSDWVWYPLGSSAKCNFLHFASD